MKIEIGKEYVTNTWASVRILCINRVTGEKGPFSDSPVVGLVAGNAVYGEDMGVGESVDFWRLDGTHATNSGLDLTDASEILLNNLKLDDPVEVKDPHGDN
jgi:hypothetical protein